MSPFATGAVAFALVGTVAGQLLFKGAAEAARVVGTPFDVRPVALFAIAVVVYGIMSVAWTLALREVSLARVYPLMGAAFVLVPLAEWALFGGALPSKALVGGVIIAAGIAVTQI